MILSYIQASLSGGFLELYDITKHKEPVYTATGLQVTDLGQENSAEDEIYLEVKTIGEIYHQLF